MSSGSLPSAAFSPAKMVYIAGILLVALDKVSISWGQFICFSVVFFVVQVAHDDYLRIVLNRYANRGAEGKEK